MSKALGYFYSIDGVNPGEMLRNGLVLFDWIRPIKCHSLFRAGLCCIFSLASSA